MSAETLNWRHGAHVSEPFQSYRDSGIIAATLENFAVDGPDRFVDFSVAGDAQGAVTLLPHALRAHFLAGEYGLERY